MKRRAFVNKSALAMAGGLSLINLPVVGKNYTKDLTYEREINKSFVRISKVNPFYFELSNGDPYIPVGCNICFSNDLSMKTMVRFIQKLAENGGNFMRLWLSHPLFEIEIPNRKEISEEALANVDKVFDLAQKHNIKVKLCLQHFREIPGKVDPPMLTTFYPKLSFNRPDLFSGNGGPFQDMTEYIDSDGGRKMYLDRVGIYGERYGNHPAVFGWELWNEMECVDCKNILEWNQYILRKLHERFSRNLVMQSLGSFSTESYRSIYRSINEIALNGVAQIHRYLDQGASLDVCKGPMDILAGDAIDELRSYQIEKPMLLAETGAVEPNHAGPSKLHALDTEGTLLHDCLFAPFFSGAAGPGHSWHWDFYIDKNNLWYHFNRFNECIKGINPVKEQFIPFKILHPKLRIYILAGSKTILIWCRETESDWEYELVKRLVPAIMKGLSFDIANIVKKDQILEVNAYDPWKNEWSEAKKDSLIELPDFRRSIVVKIDKYT